MHISHSIVFISGIFKVCARRDCARCSAIKCVNCVSFKWNTPKRNEMKWNSCNKLWDELSPLLLLLLLLFQPTLLVNGKSKEESITRMKCVYCKILIVCIHLVMILFLCLLLRCHVAYHFIYIRTFVLRIARIAATIFIHNNQLNECQLQRSIPITNWCAICVRTLHSEYAIDERKVCWKYFFLFLSSFFVVENMRKSNEGEWYQSGANGKTEIEN